MSKIIIAVAPMTVIGATTVVATTQPYRCASKTAQCAWAVSVAWLWSLGLCRPASGGKSR
jgi:hypothetical protein